jgi:integrase
MNRTPLIAMIVGATALTAVLDFLTSAELAGAAVFFTIPLILCATRRSKWLLWATTAVAVLLSAAAGYWGLHRVPLRNPWIAPANRGLLMVNLLTLTALAHQWINKSRQAEHDAAQGEHLGKNLIARNEQLESELLKIKTVMKGTRKPLVLTIKQYQAFAAQLSDLHKTMVVAAMCSGMRVSEVLALRWDQLDFAAGVMSVQPPVAHSGTTQAEAADGQLPMDPVMAETLLEWRNRTSGTGLVFPSHITGRCYHPGPIQQDYFRPVARKLGLVGVCWHTFPDSYRSWMAEDDAAAGVQQKLMRHAAAAPNTHSHSNGSSKPNGKANGKVIRRSSPTGRSHFDISTDAS